MRFITKPQLTKAADLAKTFYLTKLVLSCFHHHRLTTVYHWQIYSFRWFQRQLTHGSWSILNKYSTSALHTQTVITLHYYLTRRTCNASQCFLFFPSFSFSYTSPSCLVIHLLRVLLSKLWNKYRCEWKDTYLFFHHIQLLFSILFHFYVTFSICLVLFLLLNRLRHIACPSELCHQYYTIDTQGYGVN